MLLTPDGKHCKVFPDAPIVGFEGGGSLKPFLVRAKFPWEKQADGKSCGSQEKHCTVCTFLEEDNIFTNKEGGDKYKIREGLHFD